MVARTASRTDGAASRVAVALDGSVATVFESSRVTVLALPDGTAFAEIGVDPDAVASEVAWIGAPPRLLVLSRYAAHCTAHLLDPHGPRTLAEIRLESPWRLYATVGAAALVIGTLGPAILVAGDAHLTLYPFPSRASPLAAGAAANQFVVALPSAIEEWDPVGRVPRRRLRLPRAAAITGVGGSERLVWMTTQQEPARIDVIPLVNRGQPRAHELPEPILSIAGHPRSDLVACIGAETGQLYVIDLDGRMRMRTLAPDTMDRVDSAALVVSRTTGVLASQAGRQLAILALDSRDPLLEMGRPPGRAVELDRSGTPPIATDLDRSGTPPIAAELDRSGTPPIATDLDRSGTAAIATDLDRSGTAAIATELDRFSATATPAATSALTAGAMSEATPAATAEATPAATAEAMSAPTVGAIYAPMAEAMSAATAEAISAPMAGAIPAGRGAVATAIPKTAPPVERRRSWRDDVVAWSRAFASGTAELAVPRLSPFEVLADRFDLSPSLLPALVLLYAAHLCGERGAAPVDVARALDGAWDEALGRGELAARNVAYYAASRVALSPLVLRVLDELPPATGVLVGRAGSGSLRGPRVAIAGDEPLAQVAERCLAQVGGAILAAHGDADPAAVLFEARACGAVAMLRATPGATAREAVIFVVGDAELAEQLGLPRLE
jgi:hypothetical protein